MFLDKQSVNHKHNILMNKMGENKKNSHFLAIKTKCDISAVFITEVLFNIKGIMWDKMVWFHEANEIYAV